MQTFASSMGRWLVEIAPHCYSKKVRQGVNQVEDCWPTASLLYAAYASVLEAVVLQVLHWVIAASKQSRPSAASSRAMPSIKPHMSPLTRCD